MSGHALANSIIETLKIWGLDLSKLRGQGYDGAANMAGQFRGVQAHVLNKYPLATYTHCNSHVLNLIVSHACKVPSIARTFAFIQDAAIYFKTPQRQKVLSSSIEALIPRNNRRRLQLLCETRWVERHEAVQIFVELHSSILHALDSLKDSPNTATANKASSLKSSLTDFGLICRSRILASVLSYSHRLSIALQGKSVDLISCYNMLSTTLQQIKSVNENSRQFFSELYHQCLDFASNNNISTNLILPRGIQAATAEDHLHDSVFKPFIVDILKQMEERFSVLFQRAMTCFRLVPKHLLTTDFTAVDELVNLYKADLTDDVQETFHSEITFWQNKWKNSDVDSLPVDILTSLASANPQFFPNIHTLLKIIATLPVTTSSSERSFSKLKLLKTYLRSTMGQERLNGLALLAVHRDVNIDSDEIVMQFSQQKARRLKLLV
ncbi:52 kDa repressor of the inhibitor of the protein kinase-like [Ciona intestinalis]